MKLYIESILILPKNKQNNLLSDFEKKDINKKLQKLKDNYYLERRLFL